MLTATIDSRKEQQVPPLRHEASTRPPSRVSDGFEPCVRSLIRSLSFAALQPEERRNPGAFLPVFAHSWDQLSMAASDDIPRFVEATYVVASDDRTKEKLIDIRKIAARKAAAILRDAPVLSDDLECQMARAKTVSPSDAYRYCAALLGQRAVEVIGRAKYCLDSLRDTGMAGSVTWGRRECAFTYARCVLTDAETARAESSTEKVSHEVGPLFSATYRTVTTHTERTIVTQTTHCMVTHRVSRPDIHPATARDVPKPIRIKPLLDCVPPWMMPTLITGDLLEMTVVQEPLGTKSDQVVETSVRSQIEQHVNWDTVAAAAGTFGLTALTIGALPLLAIGAAVIVAANDPALVVGNGQYVLAGWLPEEVPVSRRYRLRRA